MARLKTAKDEHKKILKSTQSIIPIKSIENGIIITANNDYVKIVEIYPTNFLLKPEDEQDAVIESFAQFLSMATADIQIKIISNKSDIRKQIAAVEADMRVEKNPNIKRMQAHYIEIIRGISENVGVSRRFFYIIKQHFNGNDFATRDSIEATDKSMRRYLDACGNQVAVIAPADVTPAAAEILYTVLNRRVQASQTFPERVAKVIQTYRSAEAEQNIQIEIPETEYISPQYIDARHSNYIIVDGKFYTFAVIPSRRYRQSVCGGWASALANFGEGVDLDIFLSRGDANKTVKTIERSLRGQVLTENKTSEGSTASAQYILDGLTSGNEDYYEITTMLTICADNLNDLDYRYKQIARYMAGREFGMKLYRTRFLMLQAFLSSLPLCTIDNAIWKIGRRNLLTTAAASVYPYIASDMSDDRGVFIGVSPDDNTMVAPDLYDRKKLPNGNIFIAGETGYGKTFTLITLSQRLQLQHIPTIIIAAEKGHEYARACLAMGGTFITIGSAEQRINALEIRKVDYSANEIAELGGGSAGRAGLLAAKVEMLMDILHSIYPKISPVEEALANSALIRTYGKFGITTDNASLIDENSPTGEYKTMPTFSDWQAELERTEGAKNLATVMTLFTEGSGAAFNGQTNVNLDSDYVVFDLSHCSDNILPVALYITSDYVSEIIQTDRSRNKAVMYDEWWRMAFSPLAAAMSLKQVKTIRAFGGIIVFATQNLKDVMGIDEGKYGESILNSCHIKMLMHLEQQELVQIRGLLNLTRAEIKTITNFDRGQVLWLSGNTHISISIVASKLEELIATTEPRTIKRLVKSLYEDGEYTVELLAGLGIDKDTLAQLTRGKER